VIADTGRYVARVTTLAGKQYTFQNVTAADVREWLRDGIIGKGNLLDVNGATTGVPQTMIPLTSVDLLDITPPLPIGGTTQ